MATAYRLTQTKLVNYNRIPSKKMPRLDIITQV